MRNFAVYWSKKMNNSFIFGDKGTTYNLSNDIPKWNDSDVKELEEKFAKYNLIDEHGRAQNFFKAVYYPKSEIDTLSKWCREHKINYLIDKREDSKDCSIYFWKGNFEPKAWQVFNTGKIGFVDVDYEVFADNFSNIRLPVRCRKNFALKLINEKFKWTVDFNPNDEDFYDYIENFCEDNGINLNCSSLSNDLYSYEFTSSKNSITFKELTNKFFEGLKKFKIEYAMITSKYDEGKLNFYIIFNKKLMTKYVDFGFDKKLMLSDNLIWK